MDLDKCEIIIKKLSNANFSLLEVINELQSTIDKLIEEIRELREKIKSYEMDIAVDGSLIK